MVDYNSTFLKPLVLTIIVNFFALNCQICAGLNSKDLADSKTRKGTTRDAI